ncbi:hypothetical protein PYCCODRAFT_1069010 [Trametes coccinea BRFM310]|uniref:Copper transport protein n=1 Tax=Trametes coccinea (strain BRFM310) TaxID=1353009 RepID=A0A1Y2IY14_TRAC3|nr:hypothetical protein PYCCODRAFT_1069010 [Trametes coccinea BRFM310]
MLPPVVEPTHGFMRVCVYLVNCGKSRILSSVAVLVLLRPRQPPTLLWVPHSLSATSNPLSLLFAKDIDMSSSNSSMIMAMMIPWLHFTSGDNLLFETWHPSSKGAVAGACIGLVLFAILERWVDAMRALAESHWRRSALAYMIDEKAESACHTSEPCDEQDKKVADVEEMKASPSLSRRPAIPARPTRTIPPFIASHDIPRGALYAFQALLMYALMLAVMTFQAAYIISIIVGLGIGEVLFGRVGGVKNHMLH